MTTPSTTRPVHDRSAVQAVVTRFLSRYVDDAALLEEDHLITGGLLDSLAAVELIALLERQFAVVVQDDDLEIANFDSVPAIVAFVCRKVGL